MRQLIYLLLLLLIFTYCKNSGTSEGLVEISPDYFVDKQLTLSNFGENIEYVPLESNVLIASISYVECTDSLIFLASNPNGVLVYNWNGKYLKQIGRKGRGPGEYVRTTNFSIDKENQHIFVKGTVKIIKYDFSGKFLREIGHFENFNFTNLHYKKGRLYGLRPIFNSLGNDDFRWIVLDTLGNEIYKKHNTITGFKKNGISPYGNITYELNDNIYYWNHYNDTIFEVVSDKPRYTFKKDKYRLTPELAAIDDKIFGETEVFVIRIIFESKRYLFIQYRQNSQTQLCIYDKFENSFNNIKFSSKGNRGLYNDIDGGLNFLPLGCIQINSGEYLYSMFNAFDVINFISTDVFRDSRPKYPEKKIELEKLANSLDENDNPVLMLVKLKE